MARTHSLSQPFINSGDLRVALAMSKPGSPQHLLFDELQKANSLIVMGADNRTLLYDDLAIRKQAVFLHKLQEAQGLLYNRFGQRVSLQGLHHKGTCVIVGAGAGVELDAVKHAHEAGCVVITLGNACWLYKQSDIWIGNSPVTSYYARGLECPKTMAIVPKAHQGSQLWDHSRREFVGAKVDDMPNVLYYKDTGVGLKEFFGSVAVSSFGVPSTFTISLSIAAALGFTNILLTGIDLGGSLDSFYGFTEIPHKRTFDEKQERYGEVSALLPDLVGAFTSHAVRLYGIGSVALDVPCFPAEEVKGLFHTLMPRTAQTSTLRGISVPHDNKVQMRETLQTHRNAAIMINHIGDNARAVAEAVPSVYTKKEHKATLLELETALGKAACAPCVRNKLSRPLYEAFIKAVREDNEEALKCWETLFSDQYVVILDGTLRFRSDKKHLEEELERMTV